VNPVHAFDILKDPTQLKPVSLYVLHGDDAFLRREILNALIKGLVGGEADELAVAKYVGDRARLADVLDELNTLPFLVKRRVVLVEEADAFVTSHRKELETVADGWPTPGALILSVKTWPGNTRLAKSVAKVGHAIECKTPSERELPNWLVQYARKHAKVKLLPEASSLLLELVGPDLGLLTSEVEKLAVYVGTRKEIAVEDVARMVGAGRIDTIWNVLKAATTGRSGEAIADLDRLIASGEHPVGLLAMLTSSLRKVHHAGQLRRAKFSLEDACEQAGIYRGAATRDTGEQHMHLGPARVDRLPDLLLRADLDLKGSSSLTPQTVMERLLVHLARPRYD
jgi:DNA polymerase-3 subunit delta